MAKQKRAQDSGSESSEEEQQFVVGERDQWMPYSSPLLILDHPVSPEVIKAARVRKGNWVRSYIFVSKSYAVTPQ